MRPKNYTFLGTTERMRVPYVNQMSAILNELNRIAELGHDPTEYLEEFIDRLSLVEWKGEPVKCPYSVRTTHLKSSPNDYHFPNQHDRHHL